MENGNKTNIDGLLIADFQQQYEEYRQAENSRIRYIECLRTIIAAFLSFSAYLMDITGFPMSSRSLAPIVSAIFSVISFFLSSVGYDLFRASLFTTVSQLQTALYIPRLREHFGSRCKRPITNYAKLASFAYEEWYDERVPAIRLLLLLAFLTSVPLGLLGYFLTRLVFIGMFPKTPGANLSNLGGRKLRAKEPK